MNQYCCGKPVKRIFMQRDQTVLCQTEEDTRTERTMSANSSSVLTASRSPSSSSSETIPAQQNTTGRRKYGRTYIRNSPTHHKSSNFALMFVTPIDPREIPGKQSFHDMDLAAVHQLAHRRRAQPTEPNRRQATLPHAAGDRTCDWIESSTHLNFPIKPLYV